MVIVVVVVRSFRDQLPIEISGRGVRYAEADEVRVKTESVDDALRVIDSEMRWLRGSVDELREAEKNRGREHRSVR